MNGEKPDRSRVVLNLVLWGLVVACTAVAIVVGLDLIRAEPSSGASSEAAKVSGVKELEAASDDEQKRDAAILDSAEAMADAFVNLRHDDAAAAVDAVKDHATGKFLEQYEKSAKGLVKVATRAESVMEGEVLWSAIVSADQDAATVIIATAGTVANKTTDFKKQARNYRLQLEMALQDGDWLVNDLQFVQ